MKTLARLLFAAAALATAGAAIAADVPAPAKVTVCAACHGADGHSLQPIYPNLAGQYRNYLEHALHEYRDGSRKNAIMGAQAASLTDAEIEDLAAYFSAQQGPLYTPSVHQPPASR